MPDQNVRMRTLWLAVLSEVAARGSISDAARALGYTQSAVSRHVAALEAEYRAPLLERSAAGVRLTAAGQAVLRHAEAVLAHLDDSRREVRSLAEGTTGHVSVAAFPTAVAGLVPAAVRRLRADRPAVSVAVLEGRTPEVLRRLTERDADVAIVTETADSPLPADELDVVHLADERLALAVPAGDPLAGRPSVRLADVPADRFLTGAADEARSLRTWDVAEFRPLPHTVVPGWLGKLACVAAGVGVAVVPQLVAGALPAGVRLVPLHGDDVPHRRICAATRADGLLPPAAARFVQCLRAAGAELDHPSA
jgi:DNA-binding transcriptional LysR family regulator